MGILLKNDIRDRRYRLKTYRRCFLGSGLVELLMNEFGLESRGEAVSVGESLRKLGLFDHVTKEHQLEDNGYFYRLQMYTPRLSLSY